MSSHPIARLVSRVLRLPVLFFLYKLLTFRKDAGTIAFIKKIQKERGFMMWPDEMAFLKTCLESVRGIDGDVAEVGVSSAGSSKLLAEYKGAKNLHLFDTFEGLPETRNIDGHLKKGQYARSLENVKEYLKDYPGIFYY